MCIFERLYSHASWISTLGTSQRRPRPPRSWNDQAYMSTSSASVQRTRDSHYLCTNRAAETIVVPRKLEVVVPEVLEFRIIMRQPRVVGTRVHSVVRGQPVLQVAQDAKVSALIQHSPQGNIDLSLPPELLCFLTSIGGSGIHSNRERYHCPSRCPRLGTT